MQVLCRVMQVSRSGFYDWARRDESDPEREALILRVQEIHARKRGSYGSRRMSLALQREGHPVGRYQARSLMRGAEVECRQRRRYRATTDSDHGRPLAPNLLARQFEVEVTNRVWCADITAIWTLEGWLYLAAVLDLHDRQVVGWARAEHMRAELAPSALKMALGRRRPQLGIIPASSCWHISATNWPPATDGAPAWPSSSSDSSPCHLLPGTPPRHATDPL